MGAWTSPNTRLLTCSCASSGRSWPGRQAVSTTLKPCGAGATFCASSNHSRWQAERDHPSEQYGPGGSGDTSQGNRANRLCCDEANEVVVVPCGDLSPEAEGVLAGGSARQVQRHMFDGGEDGMGRAARACHLRRCRAIRWSAPCRNRTI